MRCALPPYHPPGRPAAAPARAPRDPMSRPRQCHPAHYVLQPKCARPYSLHVNTPFHPTSAQSADTRRRVQSRRSPLFLQLCLLYCFFLIRGFIISRERVRPPKFRGRMTGRDQERDIVPEKAYY